jgi:hypothetical protein
VIEERDMKAAIQTLRDFMVVQAGDQADPEALMQAPDLLRESLVIEDDAMEEFWIRLPDLKILEEGDQGGAIYAVYVGLIIGIRAQQLSSGRS